ncbi:hypothetical protein HQ585_01770 [candidate division KSB1 bacterium]|nr:hypothetical protein [candidate division KSB1 bacterium]
MAKPKTSKDLFKSVDDFLEIAHKNNFTSTEFRAVIELAITILRYESIPADKH